MAITDQIKRRIEEFAQALSQELGEVDASQGTCWLDAIENQSLARSAMQCMRRWSTSKHSACHAA